MSDTISVAPAGLVILSWLVLYALFRRWGVGFSPVLKIFTFFSILELVVIGAVMSGHLHPLAGLMLMLTNFGMLMYALLGQAR